MAANAGLKIEKLEEKVMTYTFDSVDGLEMFLQASFAQVKHLPEDAQEDFVSDVSERFVTFMPQARGCSVSLPLTMLEARLRRPFEH